MAQSHPAGKRWQSAHNLDAHTTAHPPTPHPLPCSRDHSAINSLQFQGTGSEPKFKLSLFFSVNKRQMSALQVNQIQMKWHSTRFLEAIRREHLSSFCRVLAINLTVFYQLSSHSVWVSTWMIKRNPRREATLCHLDTTYCFVCNSTRNVLDFKSGADRSMEDSLINWESIYRMCP